MARDRCRRFPYGAATQAAPDRATTTMGGTTKAISHNENPAMDGEKVNFYAKTGKKYFFVIDGYAPAGEEVASDYVIFISSCAP